ncbi:globin domain-containing protein [Dyadobacter pollutisoli]|jgi:nitric oxide dioxygenase|uniref:Globin domain-containing protein n=1 Tax=Dyadobacter pollutisoli TaxID=2910158 RepID=A0A9E8NDG4_9BACT|nr:globin domain-containing protein [Dyadobacter pollutisoli]WAC14660.1 globin domain-containing protein [Dyadobacter pollutisoli]
MDIRNMLIIKNSWSHVIAQPDNPGVLFYQQLFAAVPCLVPMFKSDMEGQQAKFTDMITYMVTNLQNMEDIQYEIELLGQRHAHYGVTAEHYELVGSVLISTLKSSLGDLWNSETEEAWTRLYQLWSSSMIGASSEMSPEKSPE